MALQKYHGIDFHARQLVVNKTTNEIGAGRVNQKIGTGNVVTDYVPQLDKDTYVCLEALTGSFEFAHIIRPYVKDVFVLNPSEIKTSNKKTDKVDATKLTSILKYRIETNDPSEFPAVYIPERHVIELRSLYSTDRLLKKQVTAAKNRIHTIFKNHLAVLEKDEINSKSFSSIVENAAIPLSAKLQAIALRATIDGLTVQRSVLQREIVRIAHAHFDNEIRLLLSIPGINLMAACAIMTDIGTIERFTNPKRFTSYLRSAPTIKSSGDTVNNGGITKRGRKLSYGLVVQGIMHVVDSAEKYRKFYDDKSIGKKKVKVRAAMVRKIFVAIYYMLKNNEPYHYKNEENYSKKLQQYSRALKSDK